MTTVSDPAVSQPPVGHLLRDWRQRRRLSQLDLALRAEVSARHLSFVETGRSQPTSDMILRLARQLEVPLRDCNVLLLAGGYAPAYPASSLTDPPMSAVSDAIERILHAHEPFPAAVIDGGWDLIAANAAVDLLTGGAAPALLEPPVNVLRLSLHPDGIAPASSAFPSGEPTCSIALTGISPRRPTTPSSSCATNCSPTRVWRRTRARTPGRYSSR